MDMHELARTLVEFRGKDYSLLKLLGAKWIALRVLFALVGIGCLLHRDAAVKSFAVFILGYALGVTAADIRTQVQVKRRWPLQQQLFDWAKIESLARAESDTKDEPG